MPHLITLQALVGFVFLIGFAFCFSEAKRHINWKLVISAFILLNIVFLLIRYIPWVQSVVGYFSTVVVDLMDYAKDGARFIFGDFVDSQKFGFVFLLVVVPTLVFFGSLIGILYFFGIIQRLIALLAYVLRKTIKLSGVESLVVISDIFLGQAEGPMIIGPYIKNMTRSELACAFTAGMANLSGSTLGIYLTFLSGGDHLEMLKFANYLVTATFMNAFSAIIFAKVIFPEKDFKNVSTEKIEVKAHFQTSFIDSVVTGATTGLKIGASMVAVLIAVISLVHLINGILGSIGGFIHINQIIEMSTNGVFKQLSLEYVLGQIFRVFAFFMGISWSETLSVGSLLGQKVAINEFVAYVSLGQMKAQHLLSSSSVFISTFALASFSNFSSIGISMGVFSVLAPTRQKELASIAWKALLGAVMAGFMTATVAGFWHTILG
jgi:CNT family concentrative nucleoside transporter